MNKYKSLLFLFIVSVITQNISFYATNMEPFTFILGFSSAALSELNILDILLLLTPVVMIIYFFAGTLKDFTNGYGKLLIIRNYSKKKFVSKILFKTFIRIIFLTLIQYIINYLFNYNNFHLHTSLIKPTLMYILTIFCIILFQILIEFYIDSQYANLILVLYVISSFVVKKFIYKLYCVQAIFFPSLLFEGFDGLHGYGLAFLPSLLIMCFCTAALIVLNLKAVEKADIF